MPYKKLNFRAKSKSVKKFPGRYKKRNVKPPPKPTRSKFAAKKRSVRTFGRGFGNSSTSSLIDGTRYFHHRCVIASAVNVTPTTGVFDQTVAICLMKNSITSEASPNQLCFNESPRWKQIYQNYEEYAVTSCKIEYIPSVMTTCGTTAVVFDNPLDPSSTQ